MYWRRGWTSFSWRQIRSWLFVVRLHGLVAVFGVSVVLYHDA
jgi:hypothetical protein